MNVAMSVIGDKIVCIGVVEVAGNESYAKDDEIGPKY